MFRAIHLAAAVTLLCCVPARAQDMMGLASSYGSSVFQQGVIAMGKPTLEAGQRSVLGDGTAEAPTDEQLAALRFEFSDSVSRRVREGIAERIVADIGESAPRDEVEALFAADELWRIFDGMLSRWGYSSANLADVMTAYYVGTWEIVNDRDAAKIRGGEEGVKAVRNRLAVALASAPGVRDMSDAEKQQTAETLGHLLVLAAAARQQAARTGSAADMRAIRSRVRESLLAQGIDLRELRLTADGFEPAS